MTTARILLVEDETLVALSVQRALQNWGYEVPVVIAYGEDALQKTAEFQPDLILMDINLAGVLDGITAAEQILAQHDIPIIYLTAYADPRTLERTKTTSPYGYLLKPFNDRELQATIEAALHRHQIEKALRKSEKNFRALVNALSLPVCIFRLSGELMYMNQAVEQSLGYTREELAAIDPRLLIPPSSRQVVAERVAGIFHEQHTFTPFDIQLLTKEGKERHFFVNIRLVHFDGNPSILVSAFDYTWRRQAEEALKEAEIRYHTLVEQIPAVSYVTEVTAGIPKTLGVYVSQQIERLMGIQIKGWQGSHYDLWLSLLHPDDRAWVVREYEGFLQGHNSYDVEYRVINQHGATRWVHDQARLVRDSNEDRALVHGVILDVTVRKQKAEQMAALYRFGQELLLLRDKGAIMRRVLDTAVSQLGFETVHYNLIDETQLEHTPPYLARSFQYIALNVPIKIGERVLGSLSAINPQTGSFNLTDQQLFETLANQAAVALENLRLIEVERQAHQTAELLRAAGLALTQTLNLDTILQTLLDYLNQLIPYDSAVILLKTPKGQLQTQAHRNTSTPLISPAVLVKQLLAQQTTIFIADTRQHPAWKTNTLVGSWLGVPLIASGTCLGIYSLAHTTPHAFTPEHQRFAETVATQAALAIQNALLYQDLQEHIQVMEKTQNQLVLSEKMAAVGRLAASLAHEINNPIQAVLGCLTLAMEKLEAEQDLDAVDKYLTIVQSEMNRVSLIVRNMRDFYRPAAEKMLPTDLDTTLESVLKLVTKQLEHQRVQVEQKSNDVLPTILANENQLKQVFLNLVLNALDAMPRGGTLKIETGLAEMKPVGSARSVPAVCVVFTNRGIPIPPERLPRIFEPFFTTKEQGSGLGLSISYGIIQAHSGEITVTSNAKNGTTFTILLPVQ